MATAVREPMNLPKGANFRVKDIPPGVEATAMDFVAQDRGASKGILYRPGGKRPRVGVHVMHPRTDQTRNYNILPLVEAGYAVLGRAGRWVNNDFATTHEHLLLDVAAGVEALREAGCDKVVLLGNSGGGPLAALYQAQAERPPGGRYTDTAAGDPFDLNAFRLPPADGLTFIGAHMGQGYSMAAWLDPSLTDESDPFSIDPSLDIFDFDNGFRIPPEPSRYTDAFLVRFREGQRRRLERIDAEARARVARKHDAQRRAEALRAGAGDPREIQACLRRAAVREPMVIYRVMADPRWMDPRLTDDGRDICAFNNEARPDLANYAPFISPVMTPEAFLSTWSGLSSRANLADRLSETTAPTVVVHYAGDSTSTSEEPRKMIDRAGASDKTLIVIPGADHYGFTITGPHQRGGRSPDGSNALIDWLRPRFPPNG